ncbi:unnamed protein product [Arabis nemorensis]|uniref:MATH domain-containing protein n=1 Tax=Arabis nemorensis TaxID=586526 RepID=A0A565BQ15_9BRAS|nr:unnamed protein product [Arabis nemorensis]
MWSSTMWNPNPSMWNPYTWSPRATFRFEIDNFSKMESTTTILPSPTFLCGGCEWYLNAYVYPQGDICADSHLSLSLNVANPNLLQSGWKRSADFYFVLSNQLGKVLYKTPVAQARYSFNAMTPSSVDGDVSEKKETVEINGFQVLVSQATLVSKLFAEHPDIAKDFKPKNEMVKTAYMNVLLNLLETINKPSKNYSETEVSNAQSKLCELIEVGFKLDWLKTKVDEVSLERKKTNDTDCSWVKQLEECLKNLEVMELRKVKAKLEEVLLALKKAEDADESRGQQLEERINNLVRMELRKVKANLEVSLERKKSDDAAGSLFQQLEKRVKNLELKETGFKVEHLKTELDDLKTGLNEVSSERTKENSRTEQLDKRVKYLELYFIEDKDC